VKDCGDCFGDNPLAPSEAHSLMAIRIEVLAVLGGLLLGSR